MRAAYAGNRVGGEDLSHVVSVCVATLGQPCYTAARKALLDQDCRYSGPFEVRNVSPSGLALQRLTEAATAASTPFFVQVGEDMILKPYAVRAMTTALQAAPPEVAGLTFPLWDTHLQRTIMGIKVLRTDVLARVPYESVAGTGYALEQQLQAKGFRLETVIPHDPFGREVGDDPHCFEVMGEHLVEGSTLLFERYRSLFGYSVTKEGMDHLWQDLARLIERLEIADPKRNPDFWALMGAIAGLANPVRENRSYHLYSSTPALRETRYMVNRGPEELVLLVDAKGQMAGSQALARACAIYDSVQSVRVAAAPLGMDPLAAPGLGEVLSECSRRNLPLTLETDGLLAAAASELAGASVVLVAALPDLPGVPPARAALSELQHHPGLSLRVHLTKRDLSDPSRLASLVGLLQDAESKGVETTLAHRLPPAAREERRHDDLNRFWSDALCQGDLALQTCDELKVKVPSLRVFLPLRREGQGRTWTRCDSPFRSLALDSQAGFSGCRAGLQPPPADQATLFEVQGDQAWFELEPRGLRNELLGKRPLNSTCRACHWNHSG